MEIAAFLIAFVVILVVAWIGWSRIPIVWRRSDTGAPDPDDDSGTSDG